MQYVAQPSANDQLIRDVTNALNGEFNAIRVYEHLAKLAPNEEVRKRILEIRRDEMRHYQGYANTYMYLTGQQPSPKMTEQLPKSFKSGVLAAFKDEQETAEFYNRVARETTIPFISHQFRSDASDEQTHAVWFLYYLHQY